MTARRRQIAPLVPTLAALFALSVIAPRPGIIQHSHRGGDHAHAHDHWQHDTADHAHAGERAGHGNGYARPTTSADTHSHHQPLFEFGVVPALAFLSASWIAAGVAAPPPQRPACRGRTPGHARAPPLPHPA